MKIMIKTFGYDSGVILTFLAPCQNQSTYESGSVAFSFKFFIVTHSYNINIIIVIIMKTNLVESTLFIWGSPDVELVNALRDRLW
jgi:hypothetical protein